MTTTRYTNNSHMNSLDQVSEHQDLEVKTLTSSNSQSVISPIKEKDICLVAKDGTKFSIKNTYASSCSVLCQTVLDHDKETNEINLTLADSTVLKHIVSYMNFHKGSTPVMVATDKKGFDNIRVVCNVTWIADWIDEISKTYGNEGLYNLMSTANYMDMKPLVYLVGARIACMLKGQPIDKIKEILAPDVKHTNVIKTDEKKDK